MLGIRKSLSSTSPFCPPIINGNFVEIFSLPPSISRDASTESPEIFKSMHLSIKLISVNADIIPGTIPPL